MDTMEVMPDYVYFFLIAPTRYFPVKVVNVLKGITSRKIFQEYPWLKKYLWGGEL
jgi:putative transposase